MTKEEMASLIEQSAELSPDRKQDILDTYAKDFELWKKPTRCTIKQAQTAVGAPMR